MAQPHADLPDNVRSALDAMPDREFIEACNELVAPPETVGDTYRQHDACLHTVQP